MATPLKLMYNKAFVNKIANLLKNEFPEFKSISFIKNIFNENWDNLELKERMNCITSQIHSHLPFEYNKQISILNKIVSQFNGLTALVFPNFIEKYGIDNYAVSIKALEIYTKYSTSEFAIRPFIVKYPNKTMTIMLKWSKHHNFHVRRLASEGCRPLLPWAMKLHQLVNDPSPILPILFNLKTDTNDYVYRSVANNLNDISKSHPKLVLDLCKKWLELNNKNTNWLVKHALRTLLKKGNQQAMLLFGFGKIEGICIKKFNLENYNIKIGDSTYFNLTLENTLKKAKYRFEYEISYLKKNKSYSNKVFQIKEIELNKNEILEINKKLNFKNLTTRKHYLGKHFIALKINGVIFKKIDFELINQ